MRVTLLKNKRSKGREKAKRNLSKKVKRGEKLFRSERSWGFQEEGGAFSEHTSGSILWEPAQGRGFDH